MADFSNWMGNDGYKEFIETFFSFARGCIYDSSVRDREEKNSQAIFVLHEAYVKVAKLAKNTGNQIENPKAYVRGIVYNKAMDFNKGSNRDPLQNSYSIDVICDAYFQPFKDEAEKNNILKLIIRGLGLLHGEIFMAMVSGKTQREIADAFGKSLGSTANCIKEIRKYIKNLGL